MCTILRISFEPDTRLAQFTVASLCNQKSFAFHSPLHHDCEACDTLKACHSNQSSCPLLRTRLPNLTQCTASQYRAGTASTPSLLMYLPVHSHCYLTGHIASINLSL